MNNEYVTGLHKYLQGQYGSQFQLNEQQFQEKLNNDPEYVNGLYGYLQEQYGSEFTLSPEEFSGKVKKKDQSQTGYDQTQPGGGSKTAQSGKTWQLPGAISQGPQGLARIEEEKKAAQVLKQKPNLKFVEDKDLEEAVRKDPSLVSSDKFYEGAIPEIDGMSTTTYSKSKLEAAQKQRDYYENWDADFESLPKQTDTFTDDDVKSNPKKYQEAVVNDYLEYLKNTNGEDSQTYLGAKEKIDYYKSLGDKLYNDEDYSEDLKEYQKIQKQALSKIGRNAYAKSIKLQNSYDWDYFSKTSSDLQLKAESISKQIKDLNITEDKVLSSVQQKKLDDLMSQYEKVQQEFSKLSEDTRIDDNVVSEMMQTQNKMSRVQKTVSDIENEDSVNAKKVKQYYEELEANKKAQEEFYNIKDDGYLETAAKTVAIIGQKTASSFVSGMVSMLDVPKITGEAFGAKGYGWTDKMSEAADYINSYVDLYSPQLDSDKLGNYMSAMSSLGEGVGSVLTFVTGGVGVAGAGKVLNLTQKSLNLANKAGQFAVASSLSTSQMYDEFLQNGFAPEQASRFAIGSGIVMGMAEMLVPEDELIANQLKQTLVSSVRSGATAKEAIENGLKFLGQKSYKIAETGLKEYGEESVGELAQSSSEQVASALTGKKIDNIWNVNDFTKAGLAGGGVGVIVELFKFGSKRGKNRNPFEEDMVGYLAENYDDMVKKLSEANPEAYDQIADRYGKLKEIYNGLKNTPAFNQLSKADQNHILAQAHTKQVILENIKQSGLDKSNFQNELNEIEEDIFLTLNKPKDAVQKPSTEEVLPRQQGATTETGGQPQGMGSSVQGQEVAQEGETEEQRQERIAKEASAGAAEVVTELNAPNALAASVFPVVGEVEAQIEKGEFVSDEKSTEAQDKLYELLGDIDTREDLTPEQKQRMSAVIENRIQKIQDYDYRTRTETSTTTQTVAAGTTPKAQKQNERAAIPVRTVAEEGIDVTYDGRPGRIELRDGQYVFVPKKLGAVQARPVVIGEAAQVNAGSKFAGVENPTTGPNNSVANITLPNGSTLSVLNDDLSIDIGLEIAKQEVGAAPQALFDTVFEEVVTENKVEVPYLRETKPAQEQAATTEQISEQTTEQVTEQAPTNIPPSTQQATQQAPATEEKPAYTGNTTQDRALKDKYKADNLKRRILDQAQRIASALGKNTQVYVYETTEEYNKAIAERLGEDQKESTNGRFLYGDGVSEIHIDLSKANEKTLPHEAVHAVLYKAFGENEKLFQQFKDKLKPLLANSTVAELENFANQETYVRQGVTAEEFLAELGGVMTAAGNRIPKTTLQKITQLLNEFLSKITGGRIAPLSTGEVIDLFNSMAEAFASGKSAEIKSQKTIQSSKKLQSKLQADFSDPVSKLTFVYDKNSKEFERLEKEGYITNNFKLEDFDGKFMFLHQPDAAFSGMIYKDNELLVEGKGGMFYPIKFHKDGYFWASTGTTAEKMAKDLNKVLEQNNGTIYMALTSAPYDKLMSSTTMSNAVLDFFSSKAFDNNFKVTPAQLKVALRKAANDIKIKKSKDKKTGKITEKRIGLGLKIKSDSTLEDIQSQIKTALNPDVKSFADRKNFTEELIRLMAENIKNNPKATEQFGKLFSEGIQNKYFKGETKTGKLKISAANMTQALSEMFTEPILKEGVEREKGGQVYAVIELNGSVKAVDSNKHESYPKAIQSENSKNKVKIHVLQDRKNWAESFIDPETGDVITEERQKQLFPTSGVSVTGLQLKSKSQTTTVYNASPKEVSELGKRSGVAYFATNKREADEYARMNRGEVREFNIPNSDIQPEEVVIDKINELGLKPKDSSFSVDESSLFELIDDRFENSLSKEDIDKLFKALKEDGVKAFEYTDETQVVGGLTTSIAVIDNKYIQELSTGLKSKSQVIPKATTESKDMMLEFDMAANKTGLAKENSVRRFVEKYGEKGLVAKEINDNFEKIQEQLGITKICNI